MSAKTPASYGLPSLTPRQRELLSRLTKRGTPGCLPLDECHTQSVTGLMRAGLATVWNGFVVALPEQHRTVR